MRSAASRRREIDLLEVEVGIDQGGVVGPVVADEKDPRHRIEIAEEVLDLLRRDGLALDVLVDLLLAVDHVELADGVPFHQIAGVEPALFVEGRSALGIVEIAHHHVGSADDEFAVVGEFGLDTGQRDTEGVLDIAPGHGHGDAAGGFGHAETAHEFDPVALEEPEDLGIEIAGGGEAPAELSAGDAVDGAAIS